MFHLGALSRSFLLCLCAFLAFTPLKAQFIDKKADTIGVQFDNYFFTALEKRLNGHYDKALEALEKCAKMRPKEPAVQLEKIKNHLLLGSFQKAAPEIRSLLSLEPSNLQILREIARVVRQADKSEDFLNLVRELAVQDPKTQKILGWAYFYLKRYDLAMEASKGAAATYSADSLTTLCKIALSRSQEPVPAEPKPEESFSEIKTNINSLIGAKKYQELITYVEEQKDLYPDQPILYYAEGVGFLENKEPDRALKSLFGALDYLVDDAALEKSIYLAISKAYQLKNDEENATKYLKKSKK